MDLKTFAVHQKLETDSPLLRYVMGGKDIPIPVVEENFRDYLEPLTDRVATRLIEDYAGLIGDEIPVTTQRREDGGYEISGEIPDRLVEAIQLVHEVTPEEIVSALVNHNTEMVHGQALAITDIDLTEAARKTLLGASSIPKVELVQDVPEPDLFGSSEPISETPVESVSEAPVQETAAMISEAPVPETAPATKSAYDAIDPYKEPFKGELAYEESIPAPAEEDRGEIFREAVQRIYDYFVARLKDYNLDSRLNLAI